MLFDNINKDTSLSKTYLIITDGEAEIRTSRGDQSIIGKYVAKVSECIEKHEIIYLGFKSQYNYQTYKSNNSD